MRNLAISTLAVFALLFVAPSCSDANAGAAAMKTVTTTFESITKTISGVKDAETAKAANTSVTSMIEKISSVITPLKATGGERPLRSMTFLRIW